MALVTRFERKYIEKDSNHSEADATYSLIIKDEIIFLQIDTYGSSKRQMPGKISQSIRFSPMALSQLKKNYFR